MAKRLAKDGRFRVLIWDRRNCGASDVIISGEKSDREWWADDLAALLRQLDAVPAWVGGGSAGCSTSLLLAARHPELVKGLLLWSVAGGPAAAAQLREGFFDQFVRVAERDGMEGVVKTDFFAERIAKNPSNRERLLGMSAEAFVAVMTQWRDTMNGDDAVLGTPDEVFRAVKTPAVIVAGDNDIHPRNAAERLHALMPHAVYHSPQWSSEEKAALAPGGMGPWSSADRIAPLLLAFIEDQQAVEASPTAVHR
jgi:pimeloyl-ACP methyl ester carboxylesterase